MIKGLVHQEDIKTLNLYAASNRTLQYIKQKLIELNGEKWINP